MGMNDGLRCLVETPRGTAGTNLYDEPLKTGELKRARYPTTKPTRRHRKSTAPEVLDDFTGIFSCFFRMTKEARNYAGPALSHRQVHGRMQCKGVPVQCLF